MVENLAIAYIRVSSDEQAKEGVSLAAQEERIRAYCVMANLKIVAVLKEEGVSGHKELTKRQEGEKVARLLRRHKATNVVVIKLDRLFRNTIDALTTVQRWDRAGIHLHIIDMGGQAISTNSAIGKMFLTMLAGFAEFERNMTSERTKAALQHKRMKGEFVGAIPFGFDLVDGGLVRNEVELKVIERMRELRARGSTLQDIADLLNEWDITTKKGGQWYPSTVRYILRDDRGKIGTSPPPPSPIKGGE
jgi:DNA invertase Pin-like site-specific DNA recombinase